MPTSLPRPAALDPQQASVFDSPLEALVRRAAGLFGGTDPASTVADAAGMAGPLALPLSRLSNRAQLDLVFALQKRLDALGGGASRVVQRFQNAFMGKAGHAARERGRREIADLVAQRPDIQQSLQDLLRERLLREGADQGTVPVFRGMGNPDELATFTGRGSGPGRVEPVSFSLDPRTAGSFASFDPQTPQRITGPVIRVQAPVESLLVPGRTFRDRELILDRALLRQTPQDRLGLTILRPAR